MEQAILYTFIGLLIIGILIYLLYISLKRVKEEKDKIFTLQVLDIAHFTEGNIIKLNDGTLGEIIEIKDTKLTIRKIDELD